MLPVIIPIAVSQQIAEGGRGQGRSRARSLKCKLPTGAATVTMARIGGHRKARDVNSQHWRAFVKLKLAAGIFALIAIPVLAFGQQGSTPPKAPKPTRADVQKDDKIISSDKAKLQSYCD